MYAGYFLVLFLKKKNNLQMLFADLYRSVDAHWLNVWSQAVFMAEIKEKGRNKCAIIRVLRFHYSRSEPEPINTCVYRAQKPIVSGC